MNPDISQTQGKQRQIRGLFYVTNDHTGISRERCGRGFRYRTATGRELRDHRTLKRIESLVIPPAWKEVWICALDNGHIQATGRDQRGRKQHLYHARWREVRDQDKFDRVLEFARALPGIRRRVRRDMSAAGLSREKVLATVVRLLEVSLIRIGNEEYAQENNSFGLTTMQDRHAKVRGAKIHFNFRGKSGKEHTIEVEDHRLAKIVRACQELPGQDLFQYIDEDGKKRDVGSDDVNEYLREISGREFTAKDFRTWGGTYSAACALQLLGSADTAAAAARKVAAAVKIVAHNLGNTPAVCRKSYIHPAIIDAYLKGTLVSSLGGSNGSSKRTAAESSVLRFLKRAIKRR
jgi:DNA topoisomerase-1